jgi:putative component of membrane protein insertase Oxa1/YidC/SpoIIIJ protein YidD
MVSDAVPRDPIGRGRAPRVLNPFNWIAVGLITVYQKFTVDREHVCNLTPTCSEYARQKYGETGFFRASYLTIERLFLCSGIR